MGDHGSKNQLTTQSNIGEIMLYTTNMYGNDEPLPVAGAVELAEIATAIKSCKVDTGSESAISELRRMIRFFNEQVLVTGYSDLN